MRILNSTPILIVDHIEPLLPFWTERLGYTITSSVPHGDGLGFVILSRDGQNIIMQTQASADEDLPLMSKRAAARGIVCFHEVDDLDELLKRMDGVELLAGPRIAPYGMREVYVVDAAGIVHGYAQRLEKSA